MAHLSGARTQDGPRFVIGIDYGTTYTGIAWVLTTGNAPSLEDINVVMNWPPGEQQPKVPSLITYTEHRGAGWGYGIGYDAHVLSWTKMKLETPSRREAIENLCQMLEPAEDHAFNPRDASRNHSHRHLTKTPEEVLTDYLAKVAAVVRQDIRNKKDEVVLTKFPIDLVITHPAIWDARARNTTFRAASKAFTREFDIYDLPPSKVMLATEPEACAQYIMSDESVNYLKKGDCFIVVDAGGGTVDLVSYMVEAVSPKFKPRRITDASSGRYGAANIDKCFLKTFLRRRLGEEEYQKLLALGGSRGDYDGGEHTMLRPVEKGMSAKFTALKEEFKGKPGPGEDPIIGHIDLPDGIGEYDNPSQGLQHGMLAITGDDMEEMFEESVHGTLELIRQQRDLIGQCGLDLKWIFLSGGFSRSRYLHREVRRLAQENELRVVQGEDSWTAVAKGAVLIGLGVDCEPPPPNVSAPYHIGVVLAERSANYPYLEQQRYIDSFDNVVRVKDHIKWVVSKGDLVTPHEQIVKKVKIVHKITPRGKKAGRVRVVLSTHDGNSHDIYREGLNNQETVQLDYDLGKIPDSDRKNCYVNITDSRTGRTYNKVEMQLEITVSVNGFIFLDLRAGTVDDFLGRAGREGYRLAYWQKAYEL
ncbi:hypothetical protein F5Y01DRAFT_327762 [Xylaria sp. FL0043]|nr:hypothetical protein F5Y01DRAFT_327762 [Xylaria sp. FL0043]